MKVEQVDERVAAIRDMAGDPEAAHSAEDDLFRDVLMAIARGAADPDPQIIAWRAVKALRIDFPRWCA